MIPGSQMQVRTDWPREREREEPRKEEKIKDMNEKDEKLNAACRSRRSRRSVKVVGLCGKHVLRFKSFPLSSRGRQRL